MKKIYWVLLFVLSGVTLAQQPIRALRTIMEVEYVPKHYELGTGMIGLGDINSDGKPDFAVSAGAIGKTFIYYGGKGVLDDQPDLTLVGGGEIEKGDLNGDGVLDLVIFTKSEGLLAELAVYLGKKGAEIKIDTIPSLLIKEETLGSDFGYTFAIGDINNDGYDDLIVGARNYGISKGKVYFYYGKLNFNNIPDAAAEGDETSSMHSSYGASINIADINGDGVKDLIIGADRRNIIDGIGVADSYLDIFYGKKSWDFNVNKFNQRLDKSNTGIDYIYLSTIIDINSDGKADVCFAKNDNVYFFMGSKDSISTKAGMIITNPDKNFYSLFVVPCCFNIGDINNDGINDYAFRASPGGYSACLIVYLGGKKLQPVAGRCKGFVSWGNPFSPIVPLGDVNGDGVNDFGTCAPRDPLPGPYNGYFVVLSGDSTLVTAVKEEDSLPAESHLLQNYPNPFNPSTKIEYTLKRRASIKLYIYDSLGREIIKLTDEEQEAGKYTVQWNGKNNYGKSVASGAYFYRLIIDGVQQETKKLLLLR